MPSAWLSLLPEGHGRATFRVDSAYYAVELLEALRRERARFTVSVPRNQAMWKALAQIPADAWTDALDMPGAQVAETSPSPQGVPAGTKGCEPWPSTQRSIVQGLPSSDTSASSGSRNHKALRSSRAYPR